MPKLLSISTGVRQLKNSFVPINRLPPEVLGLIPTFRKSERDLISASAVCAHWRRTLISTPELWNKIICSRRENPEVVVPRVEAYLKRSGSVPLEVNIHDHASQFLSSHTERILSLRMFLGQTSNLHEIANHFSKPALLLQTMSLHVTDADRAILHLPSTFFETFLSSVRKLTVRGAILSPGPCKLSQLTKFTLKTRLNRLSSVVLLDILEEMPLLQFLEAELNCSDRREPIPGNRVITLSNLEEVAIATDEDFCAPLASPILPALCLPSVRRINMHSVRAVGFPSTPILPPSFEERLPRLSVIPEVSITFGKGFKIKLFGSHQSRLTLSTNPALRFLETTFGGTPFDTVRKLHVRFRRPGGDFAFFFGMLRAMERLERLEMKQNTAGPLAYWTAGDERVGICPALITLVITDAKLDEAEHRIRELQQARERAGIPIPHVEVGVGSD